MCFYKSYVYDELTEMIISWTFDALYVWSVYMML